MSQCQTTPQTDPQLLAHNELGQIHVEANGVVTLKVNYLSLRLQADAFDALTALVKQAAQALDATVADGADSALSVDSTTWH